MHAYQREFQSKNLIRIQFSYHLFQLRGMFRLGISSQFLHFTPLEEILQPEEGYGLPDKATNSFNLILLGLLLIASSCTVLFLKRRQGSRLSVK